LADQKVENKEKVRKVRKTARRVFLDPSTPTAKSIIRTVLIALVVLVLAYLLISLLYKLSFLIFLIVISIFLAYLLDPLVKLIRRPFKTRNLESLMPRSLAIVISYLIVFSFLAVAIAYLAPQIAEQIREFAENLPNYSSSIQEQIRAVNNRYERLIPEEYQKRLNENISSFVTSTTTALTTFLGILAVSVVTYFPWILLIPILSFFFLKDVYLYHSLFLGFFPSGRWRAGAESLLRDVNSTLSAYARAQLISCIFIGTICTIAFSIIGLDYALLLGILAGFFEFIPLLGPLTISLIAVLVGGFSDNPWLALWTAIFMVILRLIHDYVTYPRIVRDGIHLHPFAVILSVLAGEQIAGIQGVFLSIPIVAILTVLYKHILEHSGRQGLFPSFINSLEKKETKVKSKK
jgi:predicted PurR-regulated permease PerM